MNINKQTVEQTVNPKGKSQSINHSIKLFIYIYLLQYSSSLFFPFCFLILFCTPADFFLVTFPPHFHHHHITTAAAESQKCLNFLFDFGSTYRAEIAPLEAALAGFAETQVVTRFQHHDLLPAKTDNTKGVLVLGIGVHQQGIFDDFSALSLHVRQRLGYLHLSSV